MTGLDTNVLIRFFVVDDPLQNRKAIQLVQSFSTQSQGFITLVCLAEFVWVLRNYYRQPKTVVLQWLTRLIESGNIALENQPAIEKALRTYSTTPCDFADCLIEQVGRLAGCSETVTFDKGAAKAAGMRLL